MVTTTATTSIPKWLARHLTVDDCARIAAAVRQVEVSTSGEIVPMIVRRSSYAGHVPALVLLALWLVYLAAVAVGPLGAWRDLETPLPWIPADLALLGGLAWGLSRLSSVQRLLVAPADLDAQVLARAQLEFYEAGLEKTAAATGILLFLSFTEHRAVVLADKSIAAKLPPDTWAGVVARLTDGAKAGRLADGIVKAVDDCGGLIAPHFPTRGGDRNELTDTLIIKD